MSETTPGPDPLATLRTPVEPVAPDPAFAAALRARLEDALLARGGRMTSTTTAPSSAPAAADLAGALVPYLAVAGAREAIAFYEAVFGARRRGQPYVMEDGRIGHAEFVIGGSAMMISDEFPPDVLGPRSRGGWSVSLHLEVADVDATAARAVEHGATMEREPSDNPYGRIGVIEDPFGHRWMLNTPPPAPADEEPHEDFRAGDVGYAWLEVADVGRTRSLFEAVLGWTFSSSGPHPIGETVPRVGVSAGDADGLGFALAVGDLDDTVARIRAAGGTAGDPEDRPWGRAADATDDQGLRFAVYQAPGGATGATYDGPADLLYLTFETPDSARARAFYGSALGWTFTPGRVDDGWQVEGIRPMAGLAGGQDRARIVPMFAVDDVPAAVAAIRAAGGTCSDPERQPYGLTSTVETADGVTFYLGER